jgi:hypothetical protein
MKSVLVRGLSMQMTITSVTFFVGLALIIVAIFGGGVEIKEVKIPTLPPVPRTMSFIVGCVLIILCVAFPQMFPSLAASNGMENTLETTGSIRTASFPGTDVSKEPPFLGAAIKNHLISVREVKVILRHLGKYAGPIDDEPSDSYFQAVAEFQVSQRIDADGYIGPITYAKLRELWPDYLASK